jgi:hypothetical protein
VPGRDIMVQAWYQGGVSVFDFTDSAQAGRDRVLRSRPDRREAADHGGYWSTYWYNGSIYGSEIARGHRRLQAEAERVPVAERNRRGTLVRSEELNTQQQTKITWPASSRWRSRTSIS